MTTKCFFLLGKKMTTALITVVLLSSGMAEGSQNAAWPAKFE